MGIRLDTEKAILKRSALKGAGRYLSADWLSQNVDTLSLIMMPLQAWLQSLHGGPK